MPAFHFTHAAGDYARLVGEIREEGTCGGRPVREWHERLSDDGRELQVWVTLEPPDLRPALGAWGPMGRIVTEEHCFSAANVRALAQQAAESWESQREGHRRRSRAVAPGRGI